MVSFNKLLEKFTDLVTADNVTETPVLDKFTDAVLGGEVGEEENNNKLQLGITNFIQIIDKNGEIVSIEGDLIFSVHIFGEDEVLNIAKKIIPRKIEENCVKSLYSSFIAIDKNDLVLFSLNKIVFNLIFLSPQEALSKMYKENHKQNHYIYIVNSDENTRVGRNMFGYNFSIITIGAIKANRKAEIIHEVMHSVTKYYDDGYEYGSHNITDTDSYMNSSPGNRFSVKDCEAIVDQDGYSKNYSMNLNTIFKTSRINLSSELLKEDSGYKYYSVNFSSIEIGGGVINNIILEKYGISKNDFESILEKLTKQNCISVCFDASIDNIDEMIKSLKLC